MLKQYGFVFDGKMAPQCVLIVKEKRSNIFVKTIAINAIIAIENIRVE
jgi:hypothetical protein